MGVRGWMPKHTWDEMGCLGISKKTRKAIYSQLSILSVNSLVTCINTRRQEEKRGDRDNTNKVKSGYVRYLDDKKELRKEKEQETKSAAGYRNKKRPKKGEG